MSTGLPVANHWCLPPFASYSWNVQFTAKACNKQPSPRPLSSDSTSRSKYPTDQTQKQDSPFLVVLVPLQDQDTQKRARGVPRFPMATEGQGVFFLDAMSRDTRPRKAPTGTSFRRGPWGFDHREAKRNRAPLLDEGHPIWGPQPVRVGILR